MSGGYVLFKYPQLPPKEEHSKYTCDNKGGGMCAAYLCHSHSQLCIGIDGTAQSTHPLRSSQANWEG